jgi:hypothetical protein
MSKSTNFTKVYTSKENEKVEPMDTEINSLELWKMLSQKDATRPIGYATFKSLLRKTPSKLLRSRVLKNLYEIC